jgi:diguanylate cyclase (GGDEF)-like protein
MVRPQAWGTAAVRVWGLVGWVSALAWLACARWGPGGGAGRPAGTLLAALLGVLCLALIGQVLTAAAVWRAHRAPLIVLAVGAAAWASAGLLLTSAQAAAPPEFPSREQTLFLLAGAFFAAFLLMDGSAAGTTALSTWLDVLITCGGAACLAALTVISPLAEASHRQGILLLVALLPPLLDIALVLVMVGQLVSRHRAWNPRSLLMLAGLAALTWSDGRTAPHDATGSYSYRWADVAVCAVAFLLLTGGACLGVAHRDRSSASPVPAGKGLDYPVTVMVAAAIALACLIGQPSSAVRPYIVGPAVFTLAAAGTRMVSALRQARRVADVYRLARTDPLTGLPNRRALDVWWAERCPADTTLAMFLLDLDGFKEVNDSLGHVAGDALLQTVAARLSVSAGSCPFVARLGGDEFAVLISDHDPETLLETALRLRDTIRKPAQVDGVDLSIDASIGIAVCAPEQTNWVDLLRQADVAMYQAKVRGHGAQLYDPSQDQYTRERLQIGEQLRAGLAAGQLEMWYQPQVDALTGLPCGVEALVRWRHPAQGLLLPGTFLPAARRAHLMPALTSTVVEAIVADARNWAGQGLRPRVAVNVAPAELLNQQVIGSLIDQYQSSGLTAGALVVEVTEDTFLTDPEGARHVITTLRRHGLEISVDDYGTGFSSLSYLRDLPLHELKIDKTFIAEVLHNRRSRTIVHTTNQLAHELGLRTVAEGVEDQATAAALIDLGVDILQGYYFSRPLPATAVPNWLARNLTPATTA